MSFNLREKHYLMGNILINQNEELKKVVFILDGSVSITINDDLDEPISLDTLYKGDYIG